MERKTLGHEFSVDSNIRLEREDVAKVTGIPFVESMEKYTAVLCGYCNRSRRRDVKPIRQCRMTKEGVAKSSFEIHMSKANPNNLVFIHRVSEHDW